MRIAIGSDHAGFELKSALRDWLHEQGHEVVDVGTDTLDSCDYPVFGAAVGREVASGDVELGVAVCGSGEGICMAANKIPGVRAGVIRTAEDAELTRRHNNANVACFGGRVTAVAEAQQALQVFVSTPFDGGRHERRVDLLADLDREGR
ncbi:MAG: ribose 5-phosphate isomerase B [Actinomycetales bacterium]|nr:ribose 5-phosphate isomerase B [Actinomycetales bacterium]